MIRIKPNRCGYTGYTCTGIDTLKEPFRYGKLVCDTEMNRTSFPGIAWDADTPDSSKYHMIDNYKNLPTQLKGFMMTISQLIDMDVALSYPEKECRTNVDPFRVIGGVDGFLNLFAKYSDRVTGRTEGSSYVHLDSSLLCFNTDPGTTTEEEASGEELTFEPGIIEPMLDTEFSPVGIELSTGLDASLDGIMIAIAMLTKWRTVVDGKLNDIYTRLGHITGIRNMLISMQMESICKEFKIELTYGDPIQWTGSRKAPKYKITEGSVYVNGKPIKIPGVSNIEGEFYRYMNFKITYDNKNVPTVTASIGSQKEGDFSLGLGGVKLSSKSQRGVPTYKVYQIVQERCMFSIELVRTRTSGFLLRESDADRHVPYIAYPYGTCPKEEEEEAGS